MLSVVRWMGLEPELEALRVESFQSRGMSETEVSAPSLRGCCRPRRPPRAACAGETALACGCVGDCEVIYHGLACGLFFSPPSLPCA